MKRSLKRERQQRISPPCSCPRRKSMWALSYGFESILWKKLIFFLTLIQVFLDRGGAKSLDLSGRCSAQRIGAAFQWKIRGGPVPPFRQVPKVDIKKQITKKNRVWDDKPAATKLDFTQTVDGNGNGHENGNDNVHDVAEVHGDSMMDFEEVVSSESESEDDKEVGKESKLDAKKKGWFSSMFQSIAGKANLEKADLELALEALKDRLMTKNVAEEIANKLCESVS